MTQSRGNDADQTSPYQLMTLEAVAVLIGVSSRTVISMEERGLMPRGVRPSGGLRRWQRSVVEKWIENGCPPCRPPKDK